MQQKIIRTSNKNDVVVLNEDDEKDFIVKIFQLYIALKLHFNSPYIISSSGIVNSGFDEHSMNSRKDISVFINVAKKFEYDYEEIKFAMISSFLVKQDTWIGDVIHQNNIAYNNKRKLVVSNINRECEKFISKTVDYLDILEIPISEFLLIKDNDRPLFIKNVRPSDEFAAIMDYFFPYLKQETSNPLWKKRSFILNKYKYLLNINEDITSLIKSNIK